MNGRSSCRDPLGSGESGIVYSTNPVIANSTGSAAPSTHHSSAFAPSGNTPLVLATWTIRTQTAARPRMISISQILRPGGPSGVVTPTSPPMSADTGLASAMTGEVRGHDSAQHTGPVGQMRRAQRREGQVRARSRPGAATIAAAAV